MPDDQDTPKPTPTLFPRPASPQTTVTPIATSSNTFPSHLTQKENNPAKPEIPLSLVLKKDSTKMISELNWGKIYPGTNSIQRITIRNLLNNEIAIDIQALPMTPENAEKASLTFSWRTNNLNNVIDANGQAEVILQLTAFPSIQDIAEFSFQIVIRATSF